MGIPVKLQVFEGPLDLLLHLIDKNKIDMRKNPILSRITYIVFPVWDLKELAEKFQKLI